MLKKTILVALELGMLCILGLPRSSTARECPAQDRIRVIELANEAKRHMEAREFDLAMERLRTAYEICPQPKLRYAMARAQEEAGRLEEALALFRACIEEGAEGETRKDCEGGVKRISEKLAVGTVVIVTDVEDAMVFVDGSDEGQPAKVPMRVSVGKHEIRVRAAGKREFKEEVDVQPGDKKILYVTLEPESEEQGLLLVRTEPEGCDLFVDGTFFGKASGEVLRLAPGEHEVEAKAEGYVSASSRVFLEPQKVTELNFRLLPIEVAKPAVPKQKPRRKIWNWIGIGVGSGLVVASLFPFIRYGLEKREARPASRDYSGDVVPPTNAIIGGVFVGVGIVTIVTSVVLWPGSDNISLGEKPEVGEMVYWQ